MADQKISVLTSLTQAASADEFAIVDVDQTQTKKITKLSLMGSPGPIGGINSSTGEFTTLQVASGVVVNDFSDDGTLSGDSATTLVTERAIKEYVDLHAVANHNDLTGLQGGDATASEFFHLTEAIYNGLFSASPLIGLGNIDGTKLVVDYGSDIITATVDGTAQITIDSSGLKLKDGQSVNRISTDTTLSGSSDSSLVTQKAVKTYVDNAIGGETYSGVTDLVMDSSSISIIFDIPQVDHNYSVVANIENEVEVNPSMYNHVITNRSYLGFDVKFSGNIDSNNFKLHWITSRNELNSSSSSSSKSSSSSSSSSSSYMPMFQLIDENTNGTPATYVTGYVDSTTNIFVSGANTIGVISLGSINGYLSLNDIKDPDQGYGRLWTDETFLYVPALYNGIYVFSVDSNGVLTQVDNYDLGTAYNFKAVWGDGNYIYIVGSYNLNDGFIQTLSVDGGGNLTFVDEDTTQTDPFVAVWGDGNFVYVNSSGGGIRSYSVDGGGNLTLEDQHANGSGSDLNYLGLWGDGNYVYATSGAAIGGGYILSYSVDGGGNFTLEDIVHRSLFSYSIWCDGTWIYTAGGEGLSRYSVDGLGDLTFIEARTDGGSHIGVWGDGVRIYVSGNFGTRSYIIY